MKTMNIVLSVAGGLLVFIALICLAGSVYQVNAGERAILLTWGSPAPVAISEGLHFKTPIAQHVVLMDIRTQKYEADASAASSDLQVVSTKVAVNFHLSSEAISDLYRTVGTDYGTKLIQPAVQEVVKATTAKYTAEELITKREIVKAGIDDALRLRLAPYGITLETTSITNFDFSAQFNAAIESKVTAMQNSLTEENNLKVVQFLAQQKVAEAGGNAKAIMLKADADAYALKVYNEQLEKSNKLIEYKMIEKWNGVLPMYMLGGGQSILMLPTTLATTNSTTTQ